MEILLQDGVFSSPESGVDFLLISGVLTDLPIVSGGANWLTRNGGKYLGLVGFRYGPFNSRNY